MIQLFDELTIRDIFAMQAMQGFTTSGLVATPEELAEASYKVADAMRKVRDGG
jgi:hypothetical protein